MTIEYVSVGQRVKRTKMNELFGKMGSLDLSYVNFDGTSFVSGTGGFIAGPTMFGNIASVYKAVTGDYEITFIDSKKSKNYFISALCGPVAGETDGYVVIDNQREGFCGIHTYSSAGVKADCSRVCVLFVGPNAVDSTASTLPVRIENHSIVDDLSGLLVPSLASYTIKANGTVAKETATSGVELYTDEWISNIVEVPLHEVKATLLSGDTPVGVLNTWTRVLGDQSWYIASDWTPEYGFGGLHYPYAVKNCTLKIEIRDASTYLIKDTANITLNLRKPIWLGL